MSLQCATEATPLGPALRLSAVEEVRSQIWVDGNGALLSSSAGSGGDEGLAFVVFSEVESVFLLV